MAISSEWVPDRGDPAVLQQCDPVGQQHGRCAVRDDQRGGAAQYRAQRALDLRLGVDVQGGQRIVHHQDFGRPDHSPGQRQPLPLAAGQRQGPARRSGCPDPTAGRRRSRPGRSSRAARTSSSVPSGRPSRTFSRTEAENRVASSKATETLERRSSRSRSRMSTPSSSTEPPVTSYSRFSSAVSVVLPEPVAPTTASCLAGLEFDLDTAEDLGRPFPLDLGVGEPEVDIAERQLSTSVRCRDRIARGTPSSAANPSPRSTAARPTRCRWPGPTATRWTRSASAAPWPCRRRRPVRPGRQLPVQPRRGCRAPAPPRGRARVAR